MTFALPSKSRLGSGLAEVTTSEIDTLTDPRASEQNGDIRVHETRKSIKRLRALLRLYRGAIGLALFDLEDARLREIGRSLGQARDAVALGESLESLIQSASLTDRAHLADHLPALTSALDDGRHASPDKVAAALRAAHDGLGAIRQRAASWSVGRSGWSAIAPGFRRTYARGRSSLTRALRRPSEKRIHTFRIDVKRHQYQLTLLEPVWPEPVKAFRHEVQRLGELLGQDHDLSLLEQRFEGVRERPELAPVERALRSATDERHAGLRREAFDLAERVYAESPGRLAGRYREYFDVWV
jgi:CHAD domain-containing protein